ncbi:MAG: hypothetical protein HOY75_10090 [Streptomyces sp.]|nr:hypothetical protein [Streptomyces sp.]
MRWAELHGGPAGSSLRVSGPEPFSLAVRPWSAAALDLAGHTGDLRPDGHLYLALDAAQHGIGSASRGLGVRPAHRLAAGPMSFAVELLAG